MATDSTNMKKKPEPEACQLDKFKRRLIRSVAWLLIRKKMSEKHVWKEITKVMGCDCKQLWEHMKSLTQKKLRRLLVAEDKYESIPEVARMSLTDWQLYDLVLVHEDLDVIGLHTMNSHNPDNKVLIDLFALVQRFDIEGKSGDGLADAWSAATVYYNSQEHQCSPMLLQKRWHQLKAETRRRRRYYEYLQAYRGDEQVPKAEQYRPTELQRTIETRFPEIITAPFPDWKASIEESLVILPDDFETRKNIKVLSKSNDAAAHKNILGRHFEHYKHILLKNLIVYTKRLDEMKVILNPEIVNDHASFFEQILTESKPVAPDNLVKHRILRNSKNEGPILYARLKYKIQCVNINIARKKRLLKQNKNGKLLKSPPSGSNTEHRLKTIKNKTNLRKPTSPVKKKTKAVQTAVRRNKAHRQAISYRNNYFILNNLKSNEADVYFIDAAGMVTQHYRTENGRHHFFQRSPNVTWKPYCCWYQRQLIIRSMLWYLPEMALRCMSVAHRCEGRCACCCEKNIQTSGGKAKEPQISTTEVIEVTSERTVNKETIDINSEIAVTQGDLSVLTDNMFIKTPTVPLLSSLIQKPPITPQEKTNQTTRKILKSVEVTQILFSYKDGNEYYKIGPEGKITQYLRNVSQAFIEDQVVSDEKAINEKVCCLLARNKLIHAWRNSKILPNAFKYIKTKHTCSVHICVGCSKLIELSTRNNFKTLTLPDIPNYMPEACTKHPSITFDFANNTPVASDGLNPANKILPNDENICTQENRDLVSCIEDPTIRNAAEDDISENVTDVLDKNIAERQRFICLNTALLLERKLNKLKNISVHIKMNKITAVLNVPVTNLTTDELRTLSNILTQAQKDIDDLKQTASGKIINNPGDLTEKIPCNTITVNPNAKENNTSVSNSARRKHLYFAFRRWSTLHNVAYLKLFNIFMNSKNQRLKNKLSLIKCQNQECLIPIPKKMENISKTPHEVQAACAKRTHNTKTIQKSCAVHLNKTQAQSKTLNAAPQGPAQTQIFIPHREQGLAGEPLNVISFDMKAKTIFKTKDDSLHVTKTLTNSIEIISLIDEISDEDERVNSELPSLDTQKVD